MNEKDEQLQNDLERGTLGHEGPDAHAYRHVFRALDKEPGLTLSGSFADKVLLKVAEKRSSTWRDFLWLGIGIFFSIITLIVVLVMAGFEINLGFLKPMSDYKGLLVFAIGLMIAFNFFEKRLLRSREA